MSLSLVTVLACGGCLSKPALKRQNFAFDNPPPVAPSQTGPVISVRAVIVSALFDRQAFVYRMSTEAYETDPYAQFLVAPSRAITIAVRENLLNSGLFKDVVGAGSLLKADKTVEVYVTELYGDFSKDGKPAAILSLRVLVSDAASSAHKSFARRIALKENTAAAVMTGWDQAMSEIMKDVASYLASAK